MVQLLTQPLFLLLAQHAVAPKLEPAAQRVQLLAFVGLGVDAPAQGPQANQQVGFFADGAPVLRSLTSYPSAESTHVLDWFHPTMRLTVLRQYARSLAQVDAAGGNALQDGLHGIKWHLWRGNAERAVEKIMELDDTLATHQDDPLVAKKYSKLKPLTRLIADFHTYMEQNSGLIVDYAERHRHGERVPTGFVELAVNQVLAKRLVKRQQMQWTKKGGASARTGPHQGAQRGAGRLFSPTVSRFLATASRASTDGRLAQLPHTF